MSPATRGSRRSPCRWARCRPPARTRRRRRRWPAVAELIGPLGSYSSHCAALRRRITYAAPRTDRGTDQRQADQLAGPAAALLAAQRLVGALLELLGVLLRALAALAFFLLTLAVFLPVCRTFSVAAATSGVSVARALSQLLDAASLALTAAGCTRSRAALNFGPDGRAGLLRGERGCTLEVINALAELVLHLRAAALPSHRCEHQCPPPVVLSHVMLPSRVPPRCRNQTHGGGSELL